MNDDDFDGDRGFDDRPRRTDPRLARARTSAPGLILIILGVFGILLGLGCVVMINNLSVFTKMMKSIEEKEPPGPDKDKLKEQIEQIEQLDTPEARTVNTAIYGGITALSVLIVVGGWKMRSLSGYPLALAGAAVAVLPFNGCGCITIPFGIWAVVTLLNPEVREAFGRRPAPSEDY